MKNYSLLSLPITIAAFAGSCGIALFSLVIIVANSFVPGLELPFSYYQTLNFPILSIVLPTLGIVALMPLALYQAFKSEASTAELADVETLVVSTYEKSEERLAKAA